ncbi:ankyrin repeat domain-containing protein [Endozoicomonas acroporae]|uniref:ankyrin repeat domain-containing protein n=1 Tax=Endozoicomonas acroporae TaxID=1701104 RepID=UPI003B848EE2
MAACRGQFKVVEQLLKAVDSLPETERPAAVHGLLNATDDGGQTPLQIASQQKHRKVADLLQDALQKLPQTARLEPIIPNAFDQPDSSELPAAQQVTTNEAAEVSVQPPLLVDTAEPAATYAAPSLSCEEDVKKLHQAVKNGNIKSLRRLLQTTPVSLVNEKENGLTPLCRAASKGYSGCVKALLEVDGILVNKESDLGWTPLWAAACNGHPECVEALMGAKHILVNENINYGLTPLCVAAHYGNTKCLSLFLAINEVKITLLSEVWNGQIKVLVELLDALNNLKETAKSEALMLVLNVADQDGKTLLCRAAQFRHKKVVALLLNALNGLAKEKKSEATMTVLRRQTGSAEHRFIWLLLLATIRSLPSCWPLCIDWQKQKGPGQWLPW